jgi:hypothetical protein
MPVDTATTTVCERHVTRRPSDDGREAATSGGDAGDDGGGDDDGDDDGVETRGGDGGDGGDDGGEVSGGSRATTGEGREASGGSVATTGGGDDREAAALPRNKRPRAKGCKRRWSHNELKARRASGDPMYGASRHAHWAESGAIRGSWDSEGHGMGYSQSKATLDIFDSTSSCAPCVFRRASQGPQGREAPFGGARQGPIVGYVLQSAAPTGPSP